VVIDKDSAPLLSEATIDFKDSLERSGFAIENPLGAEGCTCGH
jgi:Fe-S cluster assembly iron-binding protein IscA